jgi:hypothetical protein
MTKLETWILLTNCHLNIQADSYTTVLHWTASRFSPRGRDGRVSASGGKGVGLGEGYDLLRQMTRVRLTSRLRSATARQAILTPSKGRGGSTRNMNQVRMDLIT